MPVGTNADIYARREEIRLDERHLILERYPSSLYLRAFEKRLLEACL